MFDWSVPYAGSLEIYLGNGLYVVLGVQSKFIVLLFLTIATPNTPSLPRESKMLILVLLNAWF